ncbi:hypothetical protein XA68_16994 [Ophiocordyceps unilateralis]|uniref:Uncharacterized protein n=1 Tax=Ophiocordyceps unilateralis TaxID=268505 RepID=A0A2A9PKL0_OPHUN|nr:hypothetical protein XA68_16994 [Ophiocordyceps unilateralis]
MGLRPRAPSTASRDLSTKLGLWGEAFPFRTSTSLLSSFFLFATHIPIPHLSLSSSSSLQIPVNEENAALKTTQT